MLRNCNTGGSIMNIQRIIGFKLKNIILIIFLDALNTLSSEVPRPRGVSLSRASLYSIHSEFVCLDGTVKIPYIELNDDYCDCPDGSDEPGTSACPNGSFYCANSGHKPVNIPSSRVNDGVCDCCDASDEYSTDNKCVNNCNELGYAARIEQQRIVEVTKIGYQLRLEFSQRGIQLKKEKEELLLKLKKHKTEAELLQKEEELLKKAAEDLESSSLEKYKYIEEQARLEREKSEAANTYAEATEAFNRFDSNKNGMVEVAEIQVRETFDKDRNGEVSLEEAKFFLNEQDSLDLSEFVSQAWPLIKPFMLRDAGLFKPPNSEDEKHEDENEENATTEGEVEDLTEYGDEDEEEEDSEATEAEQVEETPHSDIQDTLKYDDETQKLVDAANNARKSYDAASQDVRDIQSELTNVESYLEKDYGFDEEFAVLQGQCFEYADHEYIYKICPFDKTIQQQKSSSSETRLGTWLKWAGSENNIYEIMMFEGGQHCWNGPQRSTKVRVGCGSENKLIAVSEPNRCEYEFEFVTPAICREIVGDAENDVHDEL